MPPDWDEDSPELHANLHRVAELVVEHALARHQLTVETVRKWHRVMYEGLAVPRPEYRGGIRGDRVADLADYRVGVGAVEAVSPADVLLELRALMLWCAAELARVDALEVAADRAVGLQDEDRKAGELEEAAISFAAHLHGEWVRIHPFPNGNGRTARSLVLWATTRYGLPVLVPLRPRPVDPYGDAARLSLVAGDHSAMEMYLLQLLHA